MKAMTKRLLSMLVVLAMVLSMVPVVGLPAIEANAAQATADITTAADNLMNNDFKDKEGTVSATCPACNTTGASWQPLTAALGTGVANGSHYYLPADLTSTSATRIFEASSSGWNAGTVCLHLNGKTLTTAGGFSIGYNINTILNVMGQGNVKYTGTGNLYTVNTAQVYLWGGTHSAPSGTVFQKVGVNGLQRFFGNTVIDGVVKMGTENGVKAQLYLYNNATIKSLQMGDKAYTALVNGWKGTIYNANIASRAADDTYSATYVLVDGSSLTGNVFSNTGEKLIKSGNTLAVDNNYDKNDLTANDGFGWCEACSTTVKWTAMNAPLGTKVTNGGHYYVSDTYSDDGGDATYLMSLTNDNFSSGTVCLHLNRRTIETTRRFNLGGMSTMNIMANGGGITKKGDTVLFEKNSNTLTIYGGTWTGNKLLTSGSTFRAYLKDGATFNGLVTLNLGYLYLYDTAKVTGLTVADEANTALRMEAGWTGSVTGASFAGMADGAVPNNTTGGATPVDGANWKGSVTLTDGSVLKWSAEKSRLVAVQQGEVFNQEDLATFGQAWCEHCKNFIAVNEWQVLTNGFGAGVAATGHYYLTGDVVNTAASYFLESAANNKAQACIQLNGHTITTSAPIAVGGVGMVNIMNVGNTGGITYKGANRLFIGQSGSLRLYGGTYTTNEGVPVIQSEGNGGVYLYGSSTLVNGGVNMTSTGKLYFATSGTIPSATIGASSQVKIYESFTGRVDSITFAAGVGEDKLIPETSATIEGDLKGSITMFDGRALEKEGTKLKAVDYAFDPAGHNNYSYCPVCEEYVVWTGYNTMIGAASNTLNHVYLTDSVTHNTAGSWFVSTGSGKTTHFNMNGKDVNYDAAVANTYGISVNGTMEIFNTSNEESTFTAADAAYSVVFVNSASGGLTLHDNVVLKATSSNAKPVVSIMAGTFTMKGGKLVNEGTGAAAVQIRQEESRSAYFIMEGGQIEHGAKPAVQIGQAAKDNAISAFTMTGGTVTGSVAASYGTVTLGKAATPTGLISVGASGKLVVNEDWEGAATASFAAALETGALVPAGNGEAAAAFDGILKLTDGRQLTKDADTTRLLVGDYPNPPNTDFAPENWHGKAWCPVCEGYYTWTAVTSTNDNSGRIGYINGGVTSKLHYYLSADGTHDVAQFMEAYSTAEAMQAGNNTICLNLNGKQKTIGGRFYVDSYLTLNVMDIAGGATVTFTGAAEEDYSRALFASASNNSVVNLYGGTFVDADTTDNKPILLVSTNANAAAYIQADGVTIAGAVQVDKGVFTLAKDAEITNINVAEDGKLVVNGDFTGTATVSFARELDENNRVPEANGAATDAFEGALTDATSGEKIVYNAGRLQVMIVPKDAFNPTLYGKAWCEACGMYIDKADWTPVHAPLGTTAETGKHYYIADDFADDEKTRLATASTDSAWKSGKTCWNLNGRNISVKNGFYVASSSRLNVMGTGSITYTGTSGQLFVLYTNNIYLYGGTYSCENAGCNVITTGGGGATHLLGNTVIDGAVKGSGTATGDYYLYDSAKVESFYILVDGTLYLQDGWKGTINSVTFAAALEEDGAGNVLVPAANAVVRGTLDGTVKLDTGVTMIQSGSRLKADATFAPTEANGYNAYCPVCKTTATWTGINAARGNVSGTKHFYLTDNVRHDSGTANNTETLTDDNWFLSVAVDATVHFNMNGYDVDPVDDDAEEEVYQYGIYVLGTLDLFNTNENESEFTAESDNGHYSAIFVNDVNAKFTLHDKVKLYAITANNNKPTVAVQRGTFTMEGGTVSSENINLAAVQVRNLSATVAGTFVMNGGTVVGGTGYSIHVGQNSTYNNAAASLNGGNVNGTIAAEGGSVTLDKTANATKVYVVSKGKLVVKSTWNGTTTAQFAPALLTTDDASGNQLVLADNGVADGTINGTLNLFGGGRIVKESEASNRLMLQTARIGDKWYSTPAQAVADAGTGNIVVMEANGTVNIPAGTTATVDANGHNITVSGSGTLQAMDSSNKDFDGCGVWTISGVEKAPVTRNDGDIYVLILNEDLTTYSAHYLDVRISAVNLRTSSAGLYYTAEYKCDATLAANIRSYGVGLSIYGMPENELDAYSSYTAIQTNNGLADKLVDNTIKIYSGAVTNIFTNDAENFAKNAENAAIEIYANAYLEIDTVDSENTYVFGNVGKETVEDDAVGANGDGAVYNMGKVLEAINTIVAADPEGQTAKLIANFCQKWPNTINAIASSYAIDGLVALIPASSED